MTSLSFCTVSRLVKNYLTFNDLTGTGEPFSGPRLAKVSEEKHTGLSSGKVRSPYSTFLPIRYSYLHVTG